MPPRYAFSLICGPELEEKLLDMLLVHFGSEVFLSVPISSHGTDARRLSALEQVLGRKHSIYVQVLLTEEETQELQRVLQKDFSGTGIRYWASPVTMEGECR
jgi:hypothetical protein